MTATFAHSDYALAPFAGKPVSKEYGLVLSPSTDAELRASQLPEATTKDARPAWQRDSFLAILLRVLGAPHI